MATLDGNRAAFLATGGVEAHEYAEPRPAVEAAGGGGGRRSARAGVHRAGVVQAMKLDRGLATSRHPGDLPAFCATLVEEFAEGVHAGQPVK